MDFCPKTCRSDRNGLSSMISISIISSTSIIIILIVVSIIVIFWTLPIFYINISVKNIKIIKITKNTKNTNISEQIKGEFPSSTVEALKITKITKKRK